MNYKLFVKGKSKSGVFVTGFMSGLKTVHMTLKQKIAFVVIGAAFLTNLVSNVQAQIISSTSGPILGVAKVYDYASSFAERIEKANAGEALEIAIDYVNAFKWLKTLNAALLYIADAQLNSVKTINDLKFGDNSMFSTIVTGLTIFACIACAYRVIKHFLETERHDGVKAITGYFSYVGLLVLFMFAPQITKYVVSLNTPINVAKIKTLSQEIDANLNNMVVENFETYKNAVKPYVEQSKNAEGTWNIGDKAEGAMGKMWCYVTHIIPTMFQCLFYVILGIILTTILAVPTVVMTVMIKILLSVIIYGTQLVFLLAFIPGFENAWKSLMTNLLNILLWSPIFNAVMTFIIAIVIGTMGDTSIVGILWMTIIAVVLSTQALALTTSAAGVIIQGAGAGMAGALSSLGTMNATSMAGSVISTAAKGAGTIIGGNTVVNKLGAKVGSEIGKASK